ncbi:GFA family protein [Aurantimonas sp. VKM B-3413]|uniref:GFA family protein n=1 Tax=Aurantimonas sp. VKM B-3413 TaxID=2779401 RepID=UPI001E4CF5C9|nr:GFA family protein [Aurantimonas sp. VKM B-3413]MCB8840736.1 GFA family protein [Aurantimonas sp. VKM B-3413]
MRGAAMAGERRATETEHAGGCRCGRIRFSSTVAPDFLGICHCGDCRRASGAPFLAFVGFRRADLHFVGAELKTFGEAPVSRGFCGDCGSPLTYADARLPDRIFVVLGAMDRAERYPPDQQAFLSERLPFAALTVDLPGHARTSVPRP